MPQFNLNKKQTERISEMFSNLGILFLGSLVFQIFINVNSYSLLNVVTGIFCYLICIFESLYVIGGGDNE